MAETWIDALHRLGFEVRTVAGSGPVDVVIGDLAIGRWPDGAAGLHGPRAASAHEIDDLAEAVTAALADVDLVVVENLGTIPMNLPASLAVAKARAGLPTIWHHHDPAWQRARYADTTTLPVPDPVMDGSWRHVAINDPSRDELLDRGFAAVTIRNGFDVDAEPGERDAERARLGFADGELVMVHPVRAIERKNVPAAIAIARAVDATYWLTGPAEEDYAPILERLLADACAAGLRVVHEPASSLPDLYAAADLVVFPSTWEGFGNPPIEAAIFDRAAIVGHYPVADELRGLGFRWLDPDDIAGIRAWIEDSDPALLEHNHRVAAENLSMTVMADELRALLDEAGWLP